MELWLVRHGMTEWNLERKYQGYSNPDLLPGDASGLSPLRAELAEITFSAVYSSDLRRCRSTLEYVRPDLMADACYDDRLREMNFGAWEGQTYEQLKHNLHYREWIDNPQTIAPPGGESWPEFEGRIREFADEIMIDYCKLPVGRRVVTAAKDPILIVTHGGVISMLGTILMPGTGFWDAKLKITTGDVLKIKLPVS